MNAIRNEVMHLYVIHGYGSSANVQARLAQHGHCYNAEWEPGPPSWRLTYETALSELEIVELVKDLISRYDLKITTAT